MRGPGSSVHRTGRTSMNRRLPAIDEPVTAANTGRAINLRKGHDDDQPDRKRARAHPRARGNGKDGPPDSGAAHGARFADAGRLSLGGTAVRLAGPDHLGARAPWREFRVHLLLPRHRGPGRGGDGGFVRRAGGEEWRSAVGAPGRARRARGRSGRAGRARHRRRADDRAADLVRPELQRGLHAGLRAQRRGRAPRR